MYAPFERWAWTGHDVWPVTRMSVIRSLRLFEYLPEHLIRTTQGVEYFGKVKL